LNFYDNENDEIYIKLNPQPDIFKTTFINNTLNIKSKITESIPQKFQIICHDPYNPPKTCLNLTMNSVSTTNTSTNVLYKYSLTQSNNYPNLKVYKNQPTISINIPNNTYSGHWENSDWMIF
jgi:hypothetical protein